MKINISQENINNGERNSNVSCPIALGIKESLPKCVFARVAYSIITIQLWGKQQRFYKTNKELKEFIMANDKFGQNYVEPFSFDLKSLDETDSNLEYIIRKGE